MNHDHTAARAQEIELILGYKVQYIIPIYQRNYQWDSKLLEPFWEDVEKKACSVLESSREKIFQHHMGAVIWEYPRHEPDVTPKVQVIDGQQRLTTFQIFLTSFREVVKNCNFGNNYIERVNKCLYNDKEKTDSAKFKIIHNNPSDRQMFRDFIEKDYSDIREKYKKSYYGGKVPKRRQIHPLFAYEFFFKKIKYFLENGTDDDGVYVNGQSEKNDLAKERMTALLDSLLKHIKLVVINLAPEDEPQEIFEALNSKSAPLLAMDLVKNNIFHRAKKERKDVDDLYNRLWESFDDNWWKESAPNSRPKLPRIDHFLSHVLIARTGKNISVSNLYAEYKVFSRDAQNKGIFNSVEEELEMLQSYIPAYEALENKKSSNEHDSILLKLGKKLAIWQVTTAYPVAMQIANIDEHEREIISELIYSYIVRRAVSGLTAKSFNKTFQSIAHDFLDKDKGVSRKTLVDFFLEKEKNKKNDSVRFPRDSEFNKGILSTPVYDKLGSQKTHDMLVEFENHIRTKMSESIEFIGLSIEHVLPQEWTDKWPNENGKSVAHESGDNDYEKRMKLIHTLGNLTLLTKPLNPSISRKPFDIKKEKYKKHSSLVLNEYFQSEKSWSEEQIKKRAKIFLDKAINIWKDLPTE